MKAVRVGAGFYLGLDSEGRPRYPWELGSGNGPGRQQGAGGELGFPSVLLLI